MMRRRDGDKGKEGPAIYIPEHQGCSVCPRTESFVAVGHDTGSSETLFAVLEKRAELSVSVTKTDSIKRRSCEK